MLLPYILFIYKFIIELYFRLECDVDGMPEPQVSWTHNGQPIAHSQRRELFYSGRTCTLVIHGVTPMDAGDYICRALNALGDVTTKCTVRIGGGYLLFIFIE